MSESDLAPWLSTGIIATFDSLPPDETPVLILFFNGDIKKGEIRWEHPSFEDTFRAFKYWDDPDNDGQEWDWDDVIAWTPLPEIPLVLQHKIAEQS